MIAWCNGDVPQSTVRISVALYDGFSIFKDSEMILGEKGNAVVVAELAN